MYSFITRLRPWGTSLLGCAVLVGGGCSESVSQRDVEAAKEKVNEEHRELEKARAQSPDQVVKVQEEAADVRDAQRKLQETQLKASATTARDTYVAQVEARLVVADVRIDELQKAAANQQAFAKDETNRKIDDIKARRDRVKEAVSKMKAAELLQWESHRTDVQRLVDEMNASII